MFRSIHLASAILVAWVCHAAADPTPSALRLVPFPKQIDMAEDADPLPLGRPLVLEAPAPIASMVARILNEEFECARLPRPTPAPPRVDGAPRVRLTIDPSLPWPVPRLRQDAGWEDYWVRIDGRSACVVGAGGPGLLHGVQTLRQLVRANQRGGNALPALEIRDWPSMRWRCFQDDMTRGPSALVGTLEHEIAWGAHLKMNLFTYYMEHQFAFRKHPDIAPRDGALDPGELRRLVSSAQTLGVDIVGNQQSFGHFGHILKHERYAALRETATLLTPANEQTYQLLDDLYSEVCPLVPHPWFGVCCDETWGLGTGPSKSLAEKIGVGGVYVRHIRKIHDLLGRKYGKRMMMWGDIILQHPQHIRDIPNDVILLTWGYAPKTSFEDQILPFARSGHEFFVCPGISNWNRLLPAFDVATINIRNFVRDGARHGALGMLNTEWKDDGEALRGVCWHGYAWGAECSWNASATDPADFNQRLGAVLFGEKNARFGRAIARLTQAQALPFARGLQNRRFWDNAFFPGGNPGANVEGARPLLELAAAAIDDLETCRREATVNRPLLDAFLHGARRVELVARRALDGAEILRLHNAARSAPPADAARRMDEAAALARAHRDATATLGRQFEALWRAESKPHALDRTLERYAQAVSWYDRLASRLTNAAAAARRGQPLPAPDSIGVVRTGHARRVGPHRQSPHALDPDAPWDAPASRRLGIVVDPGTRARHDLLLEVDLALAPAIDPRQVRAFCRLDDAPPREIPAQIDPAEAPGGRRLSAVLPGKLDTGQQARILLYLDAAESAPEFPGAAAARPGPDGTLWLENDKARVLIGPEGAHLYRWEIRRAADLDVTMPGEKGWAGFADLGGTRRSTRSPIAVVAHGPALVRCCCRDPDGLVKTIGLCAGASWVEVFLSEPVDRYWDFDNPTHFAGDGPRPGRYLFSDGTAGPVAPAAAGVPGQIGPRQAAWVLKHRADRLALGLLSPAHPAAFKVGPGGGAGGVGIENSPPVAHFATFCGVLEDEPRETMDRLAHTLDTSAPCTITLHAIQKR